MPDFRLRKMMLFSETIHHENGPPPPTPRRRAIVAVVANPFAGTWQEDLRSAMDDLKPLGLQMTDELISALGGSEGIDGYGRPRLPARAASWNIPPCGMCPAAIRCASGGEAKAIVPSAMKVGGPGTRSISRLATSTPPMCEAISTPWRCAFPTPRAPARSCSRWRCPGPPHP